MKQILLNYLGVLIIPVLIGFIVRFLFRRAKKGYLVTVAFACLTVIGWTVYYAIRTRGGELFGIWALMITSAAAASFITGFAMSRKNSVRTFVVSICVAMLLGTVYLFFSSFPKAEPIKHPELEKVVSVTLSCNTPNGTILMSDRYYGDLIQHISEAKPTRKQSVNDYPTVWPYYGIEIQTTGRQYHYFVYEEGEQVYIEAPYEGIYRSKTEMLDLVLKYFEEG